MIRGTLVRAALVAAGLLVSGAALAAEVEYRDVGQARIVVPTDSTRKTAEPYALSGQEQRRADAWERQGHWVEAGQSRVFVPASR